MTSSPASATRSAKPDPRTVEVQKLAHANRPKFIEMMARAFDDDPFMNWFAAQDEKRPQRIRQLFKTAVNRMAGPFDEMYTTSEIEGGAVWFPPGKWKLGMVQQLMMAPDMIRVASARRILGVMNGLNTVEKKHPHEGHYYLMALGVEPEQQGRSIGSQLMLPVLERCDRDGIRAYLESSKERNVPLYERHGFKITDEITVPYNGPKIWLMWRDAK